MLVLFLLGAAICAGAVTGIDRPETSFDESDLPVNLGLPAPPLIQAPRPIAVPVVLLPTLPLYCADRFAHVLRLEPAVLPRLHPPHSLQVLFCTFLI